MQFCRLYTGDDERSHFEELDQAEGSKHFAAAFAAKAVLSRTIKTAMIY